MSAAAVSPLAAKRLRVVQASIVHVYALAANLRHEEIAAAAKMGRDPKMALRLSFRSSPFYRRAALLGDEVLAMWGLAGDALADFGLPWLIASRAAPAHRVALLKIGLRELAQMQAQRRALIDYVDPADRRAARLLRFFGFVENAAGPAPIIGGVAWRRFERRR